MMSQEKPVLLDHLSWLGHDSFRIDYPLMIYLDPWRITPENPLADIILVSHEHHDHCSPEDVERLHQEGTAIIANPSAASKLKGQVTVMCAGDSLNVKGVQIDAVPAYNLEKHFHPKSAGHVGYILTIDGERLYFAGDTDFIPEMRVLQCDIALLPVSGVFVMDAVEASRAAEAIGARISIPMHYGAGVAGTIADAEKFRSMCTVPVILLEAE
jgi:L-ascorbate metabolism protein UlaG (beta-lactamase superfamily)